MNLTSALNLLRGGRPGSDGQMRQGIPTDRVVAGVEGDWLAREGEREGRGVAVCPSKDDSSILLARGVVSDVSALGGIGMYRSALGVVGISAASADVGVDSLPLWLGETVSILGKLRKFGTLSDFAVLPSSPSPSVLVDSSGIDGRSSNAASDSSSAPALATEASEVVSGANSLATKVAADSFSADIPVAAWPFPASTTGVDISTGEDTTRFSSSRTSPFPVLSVCLERDPVVTALNDLLAGNSFSAGASALVVPGGAESFSMEA